MILDDTPAGDNKRLVHHVAAVAKLASTNLLCVHQILRRLLRYVLQRSSSDPNYREVISSQSTGSLARHCSFCEEPAAASKRQRYFQRAHRYRCP